MEFEIGMSFLDALHGPVVSLRLRGTVQPNDLVEKTETCTFLLIARRA